jgi:hypothetical protein
MAGNGKTKLKDEVIRAVQGSSEEEQSLINAFIAGMQSQKNLMGCREKPGNSFSVVKGGSKKKQGG